MFGATSNTATGGMFGGAKTTTGIGGGFGFGAARSNTATGAGGFGEFGVSTKTNTGTTGGGLFGNNTTNNTTSGGHKIMLAQENAMISYRRMTAGALLFSQVVLVILYAVLTEYGDGPSATTTKSNGEHSAIYPYYQDVHVMIFIGFGFLMTFLKKYGFSSVGYNFLISCLAIQWAMVSNGLLHYVAGHSESFSKIQLGIVDLVRADFAAAAVMITFGAVLGKTSPLQMLLITFFELIFYGVNEAIGAGRFIAVDMGGSIFVHTFGAFFGLGLSWVISRARVDKPSGEVIDNFKNGSTKTSDMFAMVGTIFLWMFWVKKKNVFIPYVSMLFQCCFNVASMLFQCANVSMCQCVYQFSCTVIVLTSFFFFLFFSLNFSPLSTEHWLPRTNNTG